MFASNNAKKAVAITTSALILGLSGYALYHRSQTQQEEKTQLTKLRFNLSRNEILSRVKELIAHSEKVEDEIAAVEIKDVTFQNSAALLAQLEAETSPEITNVTFLANVSPSKTIRDACTEAEKLLNEYDIKSSMRQDVYLVIRALSMKPTEMGKLTLEAKRYVKRVVRDYERNGLHLNRKRQEIIQDVKQKLSELSVDFQKNLTEENTILEFTRDELRGLQEDFINALTPVADGSGKVKVPLKYPLAFPILKQCKIQSTRQAVEKALNRRCIEQNTPLIEEMVALRHQVARLLNYPTHAAYLLNTRMAETPEKVGKFLDDLNDKLLPLAKKELDVLVRLKEEECQKEGFKFDGKISMADFRYYMDQYVQRNFNVDQEQIRPYFPMDVVTKNLLSMYEEILQLQFVEISSPHVWHPEVQMYAVYDAKDSSKLPLIGYFYLDLFPREGKYGHAACFGLQAGCKLADGTRQLPVAAMVANFSAPTKDKPSLLLHSEVTTYFHEFGHVMHQICSETEFRRFSGTKVERDFVEAPSQMLENWCWEKEPLRRLSGHYQDKNKKLPDDLIDRLIKTRHTNTGLLNKRQMLFAKFDQLIHSNAKADTCEMLREIHDEILLIEMTPETNFAASFGHIAGGYDAQYYGYLWSEVYSMDMFQSKFLKEGIMNPKVGLEYRMKILARGGSMDAKDMIRDFLGREPNDEAFIKSKGL